MSRVKLWTFFPFSLLYGTVAYISLMNLLVWNCLSLDQTLIDFIVSIKFLLREMRTCQYIVVKNILEEKYYIPELPLQVLHLTVDIEKLTQPCGLIGNVNVYAQ